MAIVEFRKRDANRTSAEPRKKGVELDLESTREMLENSRIRSRE